MRHAGRDSLQRLEPVLAELRRQPGLKERRPGVFYRKSRAFLHFHESDQRLFADVRLRGDEFERLPATTLAEQRALLQRIVAALESEGLEQRR